MRCLRALARLLAYPCEPLRANLSEVEAECARELSQDTLAALAPLIDEMRSTDLLRQQERYVELFDSTRSLSLHLFEHVHGDARERGGAMVELGQMYAQHGLEPRAGELPDYLPALCEFASMLEPTARQRLLHDAAGIFTALRERLAKRRSSYASIFTALLELAARDAFSEQLENSLSEIQERIRSEPVPPEADPTAPPRPFDEVDRVWEEAAIEFGPNGFAAESGASAAACGARDSAPLHSILDASDPGRSHP